MAMLSNLKILGRITKYLSANDILTGESFIPLHNALHCIPSPMQNLETNRYLSDLIVIKNYHSNIHFDKLYRQKLI